MADREKEPTTLFSVQISAKDKERFKDVAHYRGQTMAGVLRTWIKNAHKQLPKEV